MGIVDDTATPTVPNDDDNDEDEDDVIVTCNSLSTFD